MLLPTHRSDQGTRWAYWFAIAAIILIGIGTTFYAGSKAYRVNRDNLIARVSTIAEVIDMQNLLSLTGTENDIDTPGYENIKSLLMDIRAVNPDTRFIYINGLRNGNVFFYVDSESVESEDYSPPGQVYEEASPLMHSIFAGEPDGFEIARDRWGLWASALVPIHNVDGTIVALVGMDVPGMRYVGDIVAYGSMPFLLSLILLIFILTIRHLVRREQRYVAQKAEFISIASHEIRAPLTAIRWATENILSRRPSLLDENTRMTASLILESSNNLISRVNNLLDMSALHVLKSKALHIKNISLYPIIEDIFQTLKLVAAARKVHLSIKDVPVEVVVRCDQEQIRHILVNLISNALKFTETGTEVRVTYAVVNRFHEISVHDHGAGISAEDIHKIFDGYYRTDEAREEKEGTGLGLYVARRIARMHGGDITVQPHIKKGSTFTLRLPFR
jgi:signal transduction histidine kinase